MWTSELMKRTRDYDDIRTSEIMKRTKRQQQHADLGAHEKNHKTTTTCCPALYDISTECHPCYSKLAMQSFGLCKQIGFSDFVIFESHVKREWAVASYEMHPLHPLPLPPFCSIFNHPVFFLFHWMSQIVN